MTLEQGETGPLAGLAHRAATASSLDDMVRLLSDFSIYSDPKLNFGMSHGSLEPAHLAKPPIARVPRGSVPLPQPDTGIRRGCEDAGGVHPSDQQVERGSGGLLSGIDLLHGAWRSSDDAVAAADAHVGTMPAVALHPWLQPQGPAHSSQQQQHRPQQHRQAEPSDGGVALRTSVAGLLPGASPLASTGFGLAQATSARESVSGTVGVGAPQLSSTWHPTAAQLGLVLLAGQGITASLPSAVDVPPQLVTAQVQQQQHPYNQPQPRQLSLSGAAAPIGTSEIHAVDLARLQAAAAAALGAQAFPGVSTPNTSLLGAQHSAAAAAVAAAAAAAAVATARQPLYVDNSTITMHAWERTARFDAPQQFGPAAVRAALPQSLAAIRAMEASSGVCSLASASSCSDTGSPSASAGGAPVKKTRRGCRGGRRKRWYMAQVAASQQMAAAAMSGAPLPGLDMLRVLAAGPSPAAN